MEKLKSILEELGCSTKPGIGSEYEIFAFDGDGNSIACVLDGDELSVVSNKDAEQDEHPEYFYANIDDKGEVINAVICALSKDSVHDELCK